MERFTGLCGDATIIAVLIMIARTVYGQNVWGFMLLEYSQFLKVISCGSCSRHCLEDCQPSKM